MEATNTNFVEDFIEHCIFNNIETREYFHDIKETREFLSMPDLQKIILSHYASFCMNNGLWNVMKKENLVNYLNDEDKMFYNFLHISTELPKNRYRQHLLQYYYSKLNSYTKDVKMEDLTDFKISNYYSKRPPISISLDKLKEIKLPTDIKPEYFEQMVKYTSEFIKLGQSIQFDIDGFPQNETLYLLIGMAIVDATLTKHTTFKELINHLKSYIQLNFKSLCIDTLLTKDDFESPSQSDNFYNLITFLRFDDKQELLEKKPSYNIRYSSAEKYFKDYKRWGKTEFKKEESNKSYILTEYKTKEEVEQLWDELEQDYAKNGLTDELIVKWFDGQLLTRSTCLIGCILIILKEQKYIKFLKDEMPDWKSIGQQTIKDTYTTSDEYISHFEKLKAPFKLVDVLLVIVNYVRIAENLS